MAPFRKSLSAFLVGLSLSPAAWPLGFGELQLQSELNQPLQAEIPILGVPSYAADSIRVRVGRREDFASLGYDYLPEIDDIRTEIQQRDNRLVLLLRSRVALREPLLNLVLVAEEANTRYLRDYALLLDLPGNRTTFVDSTAAPIVNEVAAPAAIAPTATVATTASTSTTASVTPPANKSAAASSSAPVSTPVASSAAPQPVAMAGNANAQTVFGPTQSGDSLSLIAHRVGKAAGAEWHAYGVALYHANPEAFIAGDPNRLKAAVALKLPSMADVQRYRRADWNALFAGNAGQPASAASVSTATPVISAAASAVSVPAPAVEPAVLQNLQQQNSELKAELTAATQRMQALETQLAQLDSRYAQLSQAGAAPVTTTATEAVANAEIMAATAGATESAVIPEAAPEVAPEVVPAPVTVQVRDTLAQTPAADTDSAIEAPVQTPSKPSTWQLVAWPLATVLALIIAGALFWQWRERRAQRKALQPRVKAPRIPKPVLPAAELEEAAVPQVDVGSPDRRMLKIKQVQSALETYLAYQRFDRALELLEHEMHIAGDDLVLRRQLQRLQKDVRKAQTEWQDTHKEQLSELFDRATTTHVDKPAARDDGKKTLG